MTTICVIICLILLSQYKVEGSRIVNRDDQISTTLSITTTNGEIYDCVDFYKQPAFRNPLTKNLIVSKALESESLLRAHTRKAPLGIGLEGRGCPFGTVPILRINRENRNADYLHSNMFSQETISLQDDPQEADHCYAIVRTNDPNSKYNGAAGFVSVYNPSTYGTQWSAARMRLVNGPDSIEVGWMAGGKGCFNLQCPGFVHVGQKAPIGRVADKISERGGNQYGWTFSIDKHRDDGNWWLSIGPNKYDIGYWPKTLFTSLADVANQVEWGGEVYNPPSKYLSPQMGCGYKPIYDTQFADFYSNATLVDEGFHIVNPPTTTVKDQNCEGLYQVKDAGYQGSKWGRIVLFGGPNDAQ